jgi:Cu/Ag efflux protein CusF
MSDIIVTIPGSTEIITGSYPASSIVITFPASNSTVVTVIDRGILYGIQGPSGQTGGVNTVNGQSGNVTLDTSEIPENPTALYFTNTRVYTKVKASLIAGSNTSITFDDALQTITIASQGNVQSVNTKTGAVVLDTDDIDEGVANLYYTDTRFDDRLATKSTDDLTEGANLYYTDARVDALLIAEDVTKQGNTFNGAEQLVKLDTSAKLPAVDGSNLTNLNIPPSTGGDLYLFYNY